MTPIAVDTLLAQIAAAIYNQRFGYLAVTGTLTDWRRHRHGSGTGELVTGSPPTARLRLRATKHAAHAIDIGFRDAGYNPARPTAVTVHGQVVLHPRWGLQLDLSTIDVHTGQSDARAAAAPANNHRARWPSDVATIGLVDPIDGEDARTDVLAVLDHLALTVIEHRVPVTGAQAAWRLSRALDRLALDERPDITLVVRGGGADIDLDVFNDQTVGAAISRHPRPVITGIGHATNRTAADDAAYLSCITPTAAAQAIVAASTGAARTTDDFHGDVANFAAARPLTGHGEPKPQPATGHTVGALNAPRRR